MIHGSRGNRYTGKVGGGGGVEGQEDKGGRGDELGVWVCFRGKQLNSKRKKRRNRWRKARRCKEVNVRVCFKREKERVHNKMYR